MKPKTRIAARHRGRCLLTPWSVAAGVAAVAMAVGLAVAVGNDTSRENATATPVVQTGERNAMGMPVIETPGTATGTAVADAVEVSATNWDLGTVPLNTAVRPSWVLRNTGTKPVTIDNPHPEVRKGCCPGPFTVTNRTIPPGGESTMTFELSMHPGMDGWHDIVVHVPVSDGTSQESLTLGVTGDFRNA